MFLCTRAMAEEPYWHQPSPTFTGAGGALNLDIDAVQGHAGISSSKRREADDGPVGMVLGWLPNVRISADGAIDEETDAVSGHFRVHFDF